MVRTEGAGRQENNWMQKMPDKGWNVLLHPVALVRQNLEAGRLRMKCRGSLSHSRIARAAEVAQEREPLV
jgi:hypothetical protein